MKFKSLIFLGKVSYLAEEDALPLLEVVLDVVGCGAVPVVVPAADGAVAGGVAVPGIDSSPCDFPVSTLK